MDNYELVLALRRMAPETGSLNCLGCGYEHSCSIYGCAVLNAAAAVIEHFMGGKITDENNINY